MKKLAVCVTLAALAMVSTLQAGECCEKAQTTSTKKAKATVAVKSTETCSSEKATCGTKKTVAKINHNIKGATLLALR